MMKSHYHFTQYKLTIGAKIIPAAYYVSSTNPAGTW
jgi:hypothetical protein